METVITNLPLPPRMSAAQGRRRAGSTYRLAELTVGQCAVRARETDPKQRRDSERRLRAAASSAGKRLGRRFVVRVVPDPEGGEPTQIGVWRLPDPSNPSNPEE